MTSTVWNFPSFQRRGPTDDASEGIPIGHQFKTGCSLIDRQAQRFRAPYRIPSATDVRRLRFRQKAVRTGRGSQVACRLYALSALRSIPTRPRKWSANRHRAGGNQSQQSSPVLCDDIITVVRQPKSAPFRRWKRSGSRNLNCSRTSSAVTFFASA